MDKDETVDEVDNSRLEILLLSFSKKLSESNLSTLFDLSSLFPPIFSFEKTLDGFFVLDDSPAGLDLIESNAEEFDDELFELPELFDFEVEAPVAFNSEDELVYRDSTCR